MAFKFRTRRNPVAVNLPSFPSIASDVEEVLSGEVQGKTASAGEERLAKAYDAAGIQYHFRYVIGAPKGLPGWKEVDFIVFHKGLIYATEVDTAFTHQGKTYKDPLHDAIILHDRELRMSGEMYPQVFHVDGDIDLHSKESAEEYVKRTFGR